MTTATTDAPEVEREPSLRDRAVDAARQVHLSHEAQHLKSLAADAVEDGVHAAKRTIKRRVEELGDLKDEAAYRMKRQPFKAVGIAVGAGLVLGVAVGWIGGRLAKAKFTCND